MKKNPYNLWQLLMVLFLVLFCNIGLFAQCTTNAAIPTGTTQTYNITDLNVSNVHWSVSSGGTIVGSSTSASLKVQWNTAGTGSVSVIYFLSGMDKDLCWTIPVYGPFNGGTITGSTSVVKDDIISYTGFLNASPASGGKGAALGNSYTYQWEESVDGTTWTPIYGSTGLDCRGSSIISQKYYFRRKVSDEYNEAYSNVLTVDITNRLTAGTINTSQTITAGAAPAAFTTTVSPTGGSGSYTYQWESSTDEVTWTSVAGATGAGYQPAALNTTTYFRKKVTSGSQVSNTNPVQVLVKGAVVANIPVTATSTGTQAKIAPPDYTTVNPARLNSIKTYTVLKPGITGVSQLTTLSSKRDVRINAAYSDGLGRVLESVIQKVGNNKNDLVQFSQYDQFGRQTVKHLPYLATTNSTNQGTFRTDVKTAQPAYYNALTQNKESYFYSQYLEEASPESRYFKVQIPGIDQIGANVSTGSQIIKNTGNEHVRIWKIGNAETDVPLSTAEYAPGTLLIQKFTDETGVHSIAFYDLYGRVIMTAREGADGNYRNELRTYYVYDDMGNVRYIVPPLATKNWWENATWDFSANTDNKNALKQLGYKFYYDSKGRLVSQEIAGRKGTSGFVYDVNDRLVMVQDQTLNNRNQGEWIVYTYDTRDRMRVMSLYKNANATRASLQAQMDQISGSSLVSITTAADKDIYIDHDEGKTSYVASGSVTFLPGYESAAGAEMLASVDANAVNITDVFTISNPVPDISGATPLLVYYYDDYNWKEANAFDKNYILNAGGNPYAESVSAPSKNTIGKLTGYKILVPSTNQWLKNTLYYNEKGNIIQMASSNIQGGTNVTTMLYDHNGIPLSVYSRISNPQSVTDPVVITQKRMEYDESGKLLQTYYAIGSGTPGQEKLLNEYTYDDQNKVKTAVIGNGIETQNYTYDLKGRLVGVNADYSRSKSGNNYFGMELSYENGFRNKQLNGDISGVTWRRKGSPDANNAYGYTYDSHHRLVKADYSQNANGNWLNSEEDYTMSSQYDEGGNLTKMKEEGVLAGKVKATVDDLTYEYTPNSNQLKRVTDTQGDKQQGDFKNYSGRTAVDDYTYDDNGNLIGDKNKGITISYDYLLGKPDKISLTGDANKYITFTRAISGSLVKRVVNDGTENHTYVMMSGAMYKDNVLQYVLFDGGRARKNAEGAFVFDYFLKDNLGNTRTVLTEETNTYGYKATHEDNPSPAPVLPERELFSFPEHVDDIPQGNKFYDYNGTTNRKFVKLNYADPARRIGTGKVLRVMAGDQVNLGVMSYYETNSADNNTPNKVASDIVSQLISVLLGPASVVDNGKANIVQGANGLLLNKDGFTDFINNEQNSNLPSTTPKAYLNFVLFDDNFQLVSGNTVRVSTPGAVAALMGQITASKNGYLYVYISNESNTDVYFDDLVIQHKTGPLLQEEAYYPYGLQITGLSSKALGRMQHNFLYNGIEQISEFELDLYDAFYRTFDPQLGRWLQVDPAAARYAAMSGYNGMVDNPVNYSDPMGDDVNGNDPPWWLKMLWSMQEAEARASLAGQHIGKEFEFIQKASYNAIPVTSDYAGMHFVSQGFDNLFMEIVSRKKAVPPIDMMHPLKISQPVNVPVVPGSISGGGLDNQHAMFVKATDCIGCSEMGWQEAWAKSCEERLYNTPEGQSFMTVASAGDAFIGEYINQAIIQGISRMPGVMAKAEQAAVKEMYRIEMRKAFFAVERAADGGAAAMEHTMAEAVFNSAAKLEGVGYKETIGNINIMGVKGMREGVFRRYIFGVSMEGAKPTLGTFNSLMRGFQQEAIAAGALRLEVYGYSVYNPLFQVGKAGKWARLGIMQEVIPNGVHEGVIFTMKLY